MCAAIGDTAGATQMQAEAERWQRRVLRLWNPAITSFDTLRVGSGPKPPPPPPPPPSPPPAGWVEIVKDAGNFCCDQTLSVKTPPYAPIRVVRMCGGG